VDELSVDNFLGQLLGRLLGNIRLHVDLSRIPATKPTDATTVTAPEGSENLHREQMERLSMKAKALQRHMKKHYDLDLTCDAEAEDDAPVVVEVTEATDTAPTNDEVDPPEPDTEKPNFPIYKNMELNKALIVTADDGDMEVDMDQLTNPEPAAERMGWMLA